MKKADLILGGQHASIPILVPNALFVEVHLPVIEYGTASEIPQQALTK
jgi:hypothetical protein